MPYTLEERRRIVSSYGLNPDQYDIDDSDDRYIIEKPAQQSPPTTEINTTDLPKPTTPKPGVFESAGRSALESAGPTAAGLLTTAGILASVPEPTGLTKIGALLAGIGGSVLASKAQRAIVPENVQQSLFTRPEDYEVNPKSTILGGFVPSALTLRPTLQDIPELIGGIKALPNVTRVGSSALTSPQVEALLNAGMSVGPSGAMYGADVLSGNREFKPSELALETLPGILMTRPTSLGRKLGFTSPSEMRKQLELAERERVAELDRGTPVENLEPFIPNEPGVKQFGVVSRSEEVVPKGKKPKTTREVPFKSAEESAAVFEQKGYDTAPLSAEEAVKQRREIDFLKSKIELEKNQQEIDRLNAELAELQGKPIQKPNQIKMALGEQGTPEAIMKRGLEGEEVRPVVDEEGLVPVKEAEEPPLTEAEQIQDEYDRGIRKSEVSDLDLTAPIETLPAELREKIKRDIERVAKSRRQRVVYVSSLRNRAGKEILGQYDPATKTIKLNRKLYAGDTGPHEISHGRILDLLDSGSPADRKLVLKGLEFADPQGRKFKTVEDFRRLSPEEQIALEERMTKSVGPEGYRQQLNDLYGNKRERFKEWLKQAGNHFKVKTGLADSDELYSHFSARQRYDAPDYLRTEMNRGAGIKAGERESEESDLPKKQAPVVYKGYQPGFGEMKGFHLYNLTEDIPGTKLVKGSTVTEKSLKDAGYEIPTGEKNKEIERNSEESDLSSKADVPDKEGKQNFRNVSERNRKWYVGNVHQNSEVRAVENRDATHPQLIDEGFRLGDLRQRWRYDPSSNQVVWSDEPTPEAKTAVENFLYKKEGITSVKHHTWLDGARYSESSDLTSKERGERNSEESDLPKGAAPHEEDYVPLDSYLRGFRAKMPPEKHGYSELKESLTEDWHDFKSIPFNRKLIKKAIGTSYDNPSDVPVEYLQDILMYRSNPSSDVATLIKSFLRQYPEQKDYADLNNGLLKARWKDFHEDIMELDWENAPDNIKDAMESLGQIHTFPSDPNIVMENWKKFRSWVYKQDEGLGQNIDTRIKYQGPSIANEGLLTDMRYSESSDLSPEQHTPSFLDRLFPSTTQKVRNLGGNTAKHVGDAADLYLSKKSLLEGQYRNTIVAEISSYPKEVRETVDQYGREMMLNGRSDITLLPEEQSLYDSIREYLVNVADENTAREIKKNPNYWPQILNSEVANIWNKAPNSPEGKMYQKEWMKHAKEQVKKGRAEYTDEELKDILSDYMAAIGSRGKEGSLTFGALRKAAGLGLPESMQDNNLLSRFSRYGSRVAKDMAYAEVLESDPVMRYMFRIKDDKGQVLRDPPKLPSGEEVDDSIRGKEALQNIERAIYQDYNNNQSPRLNSAMRLVSSAMLGTPTGIRDLATAPLNVSAVIGSRNSKELLSGLTNWREAIEGSLRTNARQKRLNELEFGSAAHPDTLTKWFNEVADGLRKYSGREALEQASRIYTFNVGRLSAIAEFGRNDEAAQAFLRKYGKTVKDIDQYFGKDVSDIPADVIDQVAKGIVDRAQGTYDARGLPMFVMDGPLAPFFSLSRWSYEKAGVISQDILKPASQGNFIPLLSYTLGSFLTGGAIQKLNELMSSGKRASEPTLSEAQAADSQQVRAVVNLLQLGSFAGMIGDLMKMTTEGISGNRMAGGLSFPLGDFVSDNLGKNLSDYNAAIQAGEEPVEAGLGLVERILTDSVQTVRLASYATWRKDEIDRKNAYRDIRLWQELTGRRSPESSIPRPNELLGRASKEFKRAKTVEEGVELLPKALEKVIENSGGDVSKMMSGFRSLKANNYQTFPSDPLEMIAYYEYLKKTQGEEEASKRLADFYQQKIVNKVKSSLVP